MLPTGRSYFYNYYSFLLQYISFCVLGWDGLEGSLAKFGLGFGFACFANVPDSEGTGALGYSIFEFVYIVSFIWL